MHNQENQERLNFTNNVRNLSRYSEQGLKRSGKRYNSNNKKTFYIRQTQNTIAVMGMKK